MHLLMLITDTLHSPKYQTNTGPHHMIDFSQPEKNSLVVRGK